MILNSLGEAFSAEFIRCGHQEVRSVHGGKQILQGLTSGEAVEVRNGLHQLSGHAKVEIVDTIPDQMRALADVAAGVSRGDFAIDTHGNLLAASQFQTAKLGKEASRPVEPHGVLAVYHEAIGSPRAQNRADFKAWIAGTSVAALRESSAPGEAERLLREILADKQLSGEMHTQAPSQLREVLLVAAPKLCMPVLFEFYELALCHGSARERGLGLHNVAKLPEILSLLGVNHPSRGVLLGWNRRFAQALQGIVDQPHVVVSDALNPNREVATHELVRALRELQAVER